jgi:hypothetical protein
MKITYYNRAYVFRFAPGGGASPHRVADLVWESLCRNNYLESSDVCA